jgi:hypothetical protein
VSVFCDHDHMIDDAREANIRQIRHAGRLLSDCQARRQAGMDTRTFGYRSLEIDGDEAKTAIADRANANVCQASLELERIAGALSAGLQSLHLFDKACSTER